jgi:hypothetical protein
VTARRRSEQSTRKGGELRLRAAPQRREPRESSTRLVANRDKEAVAGPGTTRLKSIATQANSRIEHPTLRYPREWEREFKKTGKVAEWNDHLPESLRDRWLSEWPGTLSGFARCALIVLLAQIEGVRAITDLHLADVDEQAGAQGPWMPRADGRYAERTRQHWTVMQTHMGEGAFLALQRAIVQAGFRVAHSEPDLFCYATSPRRWFFADALWRSRCLGPLQTNASGTGWFDVCRKTLGDAGRVRVHRLVPEGGWSQGLVRASTRANRNPTL